MPPAAKLSDIEIQRELGTLTGWTRKGESLAKTFTFSTFMAGISFVDRVAVAAEKMDHHPDLDIRYTKISVVLSTHSAGGITIHDMNLAREMDRLAV
ncbi:MAG TPA: 4a-hydroxytetrahydrobiopterin dehydratase [Gemmatimonadaceae bacterium]|jgi:4a-hydroxytetrahydrobiopterin dehydratase|nr:4a-hydroxytetrahydrobiopterin dehydratase [Gemmatimonadaceae bacterium]